MAVKNLQALEDSSAILDFFLIKDLQWFTEKSVEQLYEKKYGKTNRKRVNEVLKAHVAAGRIATELRKPPGPKSGKPMAFYILSQVYAGKLIPKSRMPIDILKQKFDLPVTGAESANGATPAPEPEAQEPAPTGPAKADGGDDVAEDAEVISETGDEIDILINRFPGE